MINQTFTVPQATLSAHSVSGVVTGRSQTETTGAGKSHTWIEYPTRIKFINRSTIDVKVNFANDADNLSGILASPSDYPMFTILGGTTATQEIWETKTDSLPKAYGVVVQAPAGTASSTFDIECINYQRMY